MLEFTKTKDEMTKSSFAIVPDGSLMIVTRLIDAKGHRLVVDLDGTIGLLAKKVNEMTNLPNDDFKLYSAIQFNALNEDASLLPYEQGGSL